jgi:hypothetical protein
MGATREGQTDTTSRAGEKKKRSRRKSKAKLVSKVIAKIEQKLEADELKPSVGDFIRLLQLEKELKEEEQPKEIKVSWVERDETVSASGK